MIESALYSRLKAMPEIMAYVSKYNGEVSIFSDSAPENVDFPYITFNISCSPADSLPIKQFSIYIDIFDRATSRITNRRIAHLIENRLDTITLDHEEYSFIRLSYFAGSAVPETDPKIVHYNLEFTARACRKAFAKQFSYSL